MDHTLSIAFFLTGITLFTFLHNIITFSIYENLPKNYINSINLILFISFFFSFLGIIMDTQNIPNFHLFILGTIVTTISIIAIEGIVFGRKYYFLGIIPFTALPFLALNKLSLIPLILSLGLLINILLLAIDIIYKNKELKENNFFFNHKIFFVTLVLLFLNSCLLILSTSRVPIYLFFTISSIGVFYSKLNYNFALKKKLLEENKKFSQLYYSFVDEILVAKGIIDKLLPSRRDIKNLEFDRYFRPAIIVGGDFFDIVELSETKHLVYVSDISGHGIPAGIISAMLKTLVLKNIVTHEINLEHLVKILNADFNSILRETGRYSTMFLALIDKKKKEIKYVSCGHTDALFWDSNSKELFYISSTTPILGLIEKIEVYSSFIQFNQGDYLIIPTDGILTIINKHGEQLGYEGLTKILKKYLSQNPKPNELIFNLSQEIEKFSEEGEILDDITLVVIKLQTT